MAALRLLLPLLRAALAVNKVREMTPDHMNRILKKTQTVLVKFDPPNCPDCLRLDEFWDLAGQNFPPATIWRCSCTDRNTKLCDDMLLRTGGVSPGDSATSVDGYLNTATTPSLKEIKRVLGKVPTIEAWTGSTWIRYAGGKDLPSLLNWMNEVMAGSVLAVPAGATTPPIDGYLKTGQSVEHDLLLEKQVANMIRLFKEDAGRDDHAAPPMTTPLLPIEPLTPPLPPTRLPRVPAEEPEPPAQGSTALFGGEGARRYHAVDAAGATAPSEDVPVYGSTGFTL